MTEKEKTTEDYLDQIETVVALGDGARIDQCYAIYRIIEKSPADMRHVLLRRAGEVIGVTESSKEIKIDAIINDTEKALLEKKYKDIVDSLFEMKLKENCSEDDFYKWTWQTVSNDIFVEEKAKVFALYHMIDDQRIPYYQLAHGLRMSNDDWKARAERLKNHRQKIRFILATEFDQRSEQADLVLKEIECQEDYEDRVRLLGYVIWRLKQNSEKSILADLLKTLKKGS